MSIKTVRSGPCDICGEERGTMMRTFHLHIRHSVARIDTPLLLCSKCDGVVHFYFAQSMSSVLGGLSDAARSHSTPSLMSELDRLLGHEVVGFSCLDCDRTWEHRGHQYCPKCGSRLIPTLSYKGASTSRHECSKTLEETASLFLDLLRDASIPDVQKNRLIRSLLRTAGFSPSGSPPKTEQ